MVNIVHMNMQEIESMVTEATPAQLIVISYDAAIGYLEHAVAMIKTGDIEARWLAVKKATDFIYELYSNLDFEQGGEIAQNLGCLYSFVLSRLPRINFYNDIQTAHDAIAILKRLRDSWDQLAAMPPANLDLPASANESSAAIAG